MDTQISKFTFIGLVEEQIFAADKMFTTTGRAIDEIINPLVNFISDYESEEWFVESLMKVKRNTYSHVSLLFLFYYDGAVPQLLAEGARKEYDAIVIPRRPKQRTVPYYGEWDPVRALYAN